MPAFASLGEPAIAALSDFLLDKGDQEVVVERRKALWNRSTRWTAITSSSILMGIRRHAAVGHVIGD